MDKWDSNDVPLREDLDFNGIVDSNDLIFYEGNWQAGSNNAVPQISPIQEQYITIGYELSFSVSALDNDGDGLVYWAAGMPEGAIFDDQIFSWTAQQAGTYTITFIVSDYESLDYITVQIIVD